jgi:hypothetical protein
MIINAEKIDKERLPRRKQGTGSIGTEGALIFAFNQKRTED